MTDAEILAIYAQAAIELNANEDVMLLSPLAVMEVIDRLRGCERMRAEAESYDQLSGP